MQVETVEGFRIFQQTIIRIYLIDKIDARTDTLRMFDYNFNIIITQHKLSMRGFFFGWKISFKDKNPHSIVLWPSTRTHYNIIIYGLSDVVREKLETLSKCQSVMSVVRDQSLSHCLQHCRLCRVHQRSLNNNNNNNI